MAKYLSGKVKNLKVGLDNYSENKVVLDIVGIVSAKGGLKVGESLTMNADTGSISATSFIGDGSGLEGVVGQGAGVVVKDDNSLVGTAGTINLGTNLVATPVSAGIVTINVTPEIDLVNIGAQTLEVSGIATFKEDLQFISAGSTVAVFDINTGSLGIGSLSPAAKLDVKGTIETDALKVVGIATIGLVTVYGATGIVSATQYYGSGINLTGIGDTEYIDSASLRVNGITTVGFITATDVWVSGTVTATTFKGTLDGSATSAGSATNASGLTGNPSIDVSNIVGTALSISGGISTLGVTSATDLEAQNLNVSGISSVGAAITMYGATGIVSATKYYGDGSDLSGITADTFGTLTSLNVSGIATLGSVKFETVGIVTAKESTGIVTYYGDGSKLTGLVSGITTGIGTFIASAGVGTDIDIFNHTTHDYKTADYTIHFENVETQAQKLLLMQNNTSVYTNEFAIMYSGSGPIVSIGSSVDGNNIRLLATPETGISGLTTYRWTRHVQ